MHYQRRIQAWHIHSCHTISTLKTNHIGKKSLGPCCHRRVITKCVQSMRIRTVNHLHLLASIKLRDSGDSVTGMQFDSKFKCQGVTQNANRKKINEH